MVGIQGVDQVFDKNLQRNRRFWKPLLNIDLSLVSALFHKRKKHLCM